MNRAFSEKQKYLTSYASFHLTKWYDHIIFDDAQIKTREWKSRSGKITAGIPIKSQTRCLRKDPVSYSDRIKERQKMFTIFCISKNVRVVLLCSAHEQHEFVDLIHES
jgi:hypothetical protein